VSNGSAQTEAPARLGRDYQRLFLSSTISNLGDGMFLVALPLLAARLTRDEVEVSLVTASMALPWLVLSIPVGTLIDRADRKRVLIIADLFRAVVVAGLAIAAATGEAQIWMLWIAALALGTAEVFFDNASQALVPSVVAPELLEKANGRRTAGEIVANTFVGTPIGTLLFATAVWIPFGVDAATFVVAVVLLVPIRGTFRPRGSDTAPRTTSLRQETKEGIRWLWRHPLLRTMAICLGLSNLGFHMAQAVFVLFAQERLGISERGYGLLLGVMGIGAIAGALLGGRISARLGQSFAIVAVLGTWVVTMAGTGLILVTWFVVLMAFLESMAATVWNVVTVSLRQQIVPPELFGRVNSVYRWFGWGTLPIGAVIGGQVAHHFGLRAPYLVGAGSVLLALLVAIPNIRPAAIAAAKLAARPETNESANVSPAPTTR
jgi:predicted MFS family arabinose efflux permease